MTIEKQLIEAWHINNRVNLMLIDAISAQGLECTLSKRGGRNVAAQFVHLHWLRLWRFRRHAKELLKGQTDFDKNEKVTKPLLKKRLKESAAAMATWIQMGVNNGGEIKGFKRGVIPMVGYLISHESHHRGIVLTTLKECGHPVPKDIRDGIWAWSQI